MGIRSPGEESTPTFALTGPLEHHITADVAIAAWQYFEEMTDTVWLRRKAFLLCVSVRNSGFHGQT